MKMFCMTLFFIGTLSLVGCATTQTKTTQATEKKQTTQVQKSGTYFGTGFGVGVASF